MADVTGASLAPIYSRLNNAPTYHPLEADTFADWSVEAGDIVTVTRDDKSYQSPVHSSTITWKKGAQVSISSTGRQERESIARMSSRKFSSGSGGGGLRNSQYQHLYVEDQYKQMKAGLELSTSHVSLYIQDNYNQMKSGLYLTSSSAALYVDNKYSQMRAGLNLTSSSAALYVQDNYKQLRSGLALTSSSAALYVENKYTQMRSGLDMTSSSAALYVESKYNQMRSGLDLTSSSASLYVDNKYNQIKSGLNLTSSSAALYVDNKYTQMKSGLNLTSSSAALYVDNKYNQMKSGLNLTSSSAALYVDNKYNQMKSGLGLTSSSAALYVENRYNQMKAGLNLTSSSAALYARSRTSKAEIIARINEDGGSEALISADRVSISGTTTINDVMTISDQRVYIKEPTRINGDIMLSSLTMRSGNDANTISPEIFAKIIKKASVSGNTLTLTAIDGTETTFSKAATIKGTWSGGVYTVSATAAASGGVVPPISTTLGKKSETWSGMTGTLSVGYEDPVSGNMIATGCSIPLTGPDLHSVYCTTPYGEEDDDGHKNTSGSGNQAYYRSGSTWGMVVKCQVRDENGNVLATLRDYLEGGPTAIANAAGGGDSYTRYTFSKSRTASSDGYHYTFSIGTGWQTPFGGDGGTYYLYKKD